MPFDPRDPTVKLCLQAMALDERSPEEAAAVRLQAWNEASTHFAKFLAAFFLGTHEARAAARLHWLERSLEHASESGDPSAVTALRTLHARLAEACEELGDHERAASYRAPASSAPATPLDPGPFFHGTRADLRPGDLLTPGRQSNYQRDLVMNHVYFTALLDGAALAAALARGDAPERVYAVEPTGAFEDDPNVTDKKFPGNLTRSYRTAEPLRVIREATGWSRRDGEEVRAWRERLARSRGEIIN